MKKKRSYIFCLLAISTIIFVVIVCFSGCDKKDKVTYDDSYELTVREGCSDFYYLHLSENQQKMYRMLYKEAEDVLYNGQEKDTLGTYKFSDYGLSYDEAVTVWYAFRYDASAFFIISNSYSYNNNSMTVKIAPEFTDKGVREKVLESIENSVGEVRRMLDGVEASAMKFKVIYDYVINHTGYKSDSNGAPIFDGYSYSIAGPLDGNIITMTICQGYCEAISYLCNTFGIECVYVGSEFRNHALNIVNIDGNWYYADATLDDTPDDYKYFLKSGDNYWQMHSAQYDNPSENFLKSVLPKLDYNSYDTYFGRARNGDFIYSFSKERGQYNCDIVSVGEEVESIEDIPTQVGVYEVKSYNFYNSKNLKRVKIPDGFTYGGSYSSCKKLISVELPQSVTKIGSFFGCSSLESIEIPSGVTHIESFAWCSSMKSFKIPDSITSIGDCAFSGCRNLTSVYIPKSVTDMGWFVFQGCGDLTIYCEAESQPSGWQSEWTRPEYQVVWGYKPS